MNFLARYKKKGHGFHPEHPIQKRIRIFFDSIGNPLFLAIIKYFSTLCRPKFRHSYVNKHGSNHIKFIMP